MERDLKIVDENAESELKSLYKRRKELNDLITEKETSLEIKSKKNILYLVQLLDEKTKRIAELEDLFNEAKKELIEVKMEKETILKINQESAIKLKQVKNTVQSNEGEIIEEEKNYYE